jgi:hypothetical protein
MFLLTTSLGCTESKTWRQDCGLLVQALERVASKAEGDNNRGYGDQFKGEQVTCVLRFKSVSTNEKGEESLLFDLEPFGMRYEFFSGKPVMIGFKPASGSSEMWRATPPGSEVRVSAVVGSVTFATLSPGNNPTKQVYIAAASLEDARILMN